MRTTPPFHFSITSFSRDHIFSTEGGDYQIRSFVRHLHPVVRGCNVLSARTAAPSSRFLLTATHFFPIAVWGRPRRALTALPCSAELTARGALGNELRPGFQPHSAIPPPFQGNANGAAGCPPNPITQGIGLDICFHRMETGRTKGR